MTTSSHCSYLTVSIRCTSFWLNQSVMCVVPSPLARWCACMWAMANHPQLPAAPPVWLTCGNGEAPLERHSGISACVDCVYPRGLLTRLMPGCSSVIFQGTISPIAHSETIYVCACTCVSVCLSSLRDWFSELHRVCLTVLLTLTWTADNCLMEMQQRKRLEWTEEGLRKILKREL